MDTEVIKANINVHSKMADTYEKLEPHFKTENKEKVKDVIIKLAKRFGNSRLLDIGCGTGFIISLAKDVFSHIDGVDVTQAMMDKVDLSNGNITLHRSAAEKVPFEDETFDMVSAYSFIHHVEDYNPVLSEVFRVLKPGGGVYIDLEPNRGFWDLMTAIGNQKRIDFSPILNKAIDSVISTDEKVEQDFGIPKSTFQKAEFGKSIMGGIDAVELEKQARVIGFKNIEISYEWFLGQGDVMHGRSFQDSDTVEWFLRQLSPISDKLFKYIKCILVK